MSSSPQLFYFNNELSNAASVKKPHRKTKEFTRCEAAYLGKSSNIIEHGKRGSKYILNNHGKKSYCTSQLTNAKIQRLLLKKGGGREDKKSTIISLINGIEKDLRYIKQSLKTI